MWDYDAPTGTWRDEDLSVRLLARAERIAERRAVLMDIPSKPIVRIDEDGTGGYRAHRDERFPEYGWAFPADTPEDRIVEKLAGILRRVTHWVLLPHLRRTDESCFVCSCGLRFLVPADYGRDDHGRTAHVAENPSHVITWVQRPGKTMAFYGIGFTPAPAGLPVLDENLPFPEFS